jgi:hypothetical protein
MANNNSPIATETKIRKVKIQEGFHIAIIDNSDVLGAQGYMLQSSFVVDNHVICIYQRTR